MPRRTFASEKELQDYAGQTGKVCRLEGVAKWQRLLSPEQYEIVEARTSRGVSWVMLFSKAIVQAEGDQCTAKRGHDCEPLRAAATLCVAVRSS